MSVCRLGASGSGGVLQSFCGQVGNTVAFAESLTAPDIDLIYSIGPNMLPVRDFEYVRRRKEGRARKGARSERKRGG